MSKEKWYPYVWSPWTQKLLVSFLAEPKITVEWDVKWMVLTLWFTKHMQVFNTLADHRTHWTAVKRMVRPWVNLDGLPFAHSEFIIKESSVVCGTYSGKGGMQGVWSWEGFGRQHLLEARGGQRMLTLLLSCWPVLYKSKWPDDSWNYNSK